MELKTKADRDYLIRVYNLAKPGTLFDIKLVARTLEERKSLGRLRSHGYVGKQTLGSFYLTESGLEAAKLAEELRDQEEEQRADEEATRAAERANLDQQTKKQFRHDWRIAIFETVAGFLLGAIADHFFDIVGNASSTVLALLRALGLLH